MTPERWQRIESVAIALAALAVALVVDAWWLPLALFLAFDLSALGYVLNTRVGAFAYNAVHSYIAPTLLLGWAWAAHAWEGPGDARWLLIVAVSWAFHVAADRALGYGLKHADSFQHTHLGWIGKRNPAHNHAE